VLLFSYYQGLLRILKETQTKGAGNLISAPVFIHHTSVYCLSLPNAEHLGTTSRAGALSCWLAILHGNRLGGFHFLLGSALYTISLHGFTSFL